MDLIVNTDYEPGTPQYCKEQQLAAVKAIQDAQIEAKGDKNPNGDPRYEEVWKTHGVYVGAGNTALDEAVAWRKKACDALADASTYLAELCDQANKMYQDTDDFAAANLKKQMVFGDGS
ncbi:MAG: ESX-1 secretion-associated protein [Mycobacteriaceae bacterium]|nr:ESX-1 secretion-associated protein [Mycobacteriaceae bacterium]